MITTAYSRYKYDLCFIHMKKYEYAAWMLMTLGVCWI
jgi:hypothetical protein